MSTATSSEDLFFDTLVQGYVEKNPRFLRRDWLAKQLDEKLREPGTRFVLLTAEPGAGKSAFMAQLAHDHPEWLRYFIRRDQREMLADVSTRSLLLRIGYQLAVQRPDLFTKEQLTLSVKMRLGEVDKGGEAVGVEIGKLIRSPFYRNLGIDVDQQAEQIRGKLVAMRINELYVEERLLPDEDLLHLALINPARTLMRLDPTGHIVILIDALDEVRYHAAAENILTWLTNCPYLPENIQLVLTSRPLDEALTLFGVKQASRLRQLAIAEDDPSVQADTRRFVKQWVKEPKVSQAITEVEGNLEAFTKKATGKVDGNLGYVDALARGIDRAIADMRGIEEASREQGRKTLKALLSLNELPDDLSGLYAFFLNQIRTSVERERIEQKDSQTSEIYDKAVWPAVYAPLLGVLAVAMEPVDVGLLVKLGGISVAQEWVYPAIERLIHFIDVSNGRYRLYHTTVAEFLTSKQTYDNPKTRMLYQDPLKLHQQIADHYWRYRDNWTQCDAYGLDSLAVHFFKSGDSQRLFQLIDPSWMRARTATQNSSYSGFLTDLAVIREDIRRLAGVTDCSSILLSQAIRLTLTRTCITSVMKGYPPALVAQAATRGLWPVERALNIARQIPSAEDRAHMYAVLLSAGLVGDARQTAVKEGLEAILEIYFDHNQGRALVKLAPFLDEGEQLDKAWNVAAKIRIKWQEVRALAKSALAIRIGGAQREAALRSALIDSLEAEDGDPMDTLPMLAPHLTETLQTFALKNERTLSSVVTALGSQLSQATLSRLEKRASRVADIDLRFRILGALAPRMPAHRRVCISAKALAALMKERNNWVSSRMVTDLALWIDESLLPKMLESISSFTSKDECVKALCSIALRFGTTRYARTIATKALRIAMGRRDAHLVEQLMPLLNARQLISVRNAALAPDSWVPTSTVLALLPRLTPEQSSELLTRLSDLDGHELERMVDQFVEMVDAMPKQRRPEWIEWLFERVCEMESPAKQAMALESIAKELSDEMVERGLRSDLSRRERDHIGDLQLLIRTILKGGRPHRPELDQDAEDPLPLAEDPRHALEEVLGIVKPLDRARALTVVFRDLQGPDLDEAVLEYLGFVNSSSAWNWDKLDPRIASLAPHLRDDVREKAIGVGVDFLRQGHGEALVALARDLTEEQLARVFSVAVELPNPDDDMISSRFSRVARVESAQAELLARVASQLTELQLLEALAKAGQLRGESRVVALAGIAPHLHEEQRAKAITDAIEALEHVDLRAEETMFGLVGPLIGAAQRERAIEMAESQGRAIGRARALCGLQPFFTPTIDIVPRIRRAFIDHILDDYEDGDCGEFLSGFQEELLARSLLDAESLRAIDDNLTEIATCWSWL